MNPWPQENNVAKNHLKKNEKNLNLTTSLIWSLNSTLSACEHGRWLSSTPIRASWDSLVNKVFLCHAMNAIFFLQHFNTVQWFLFVLTFSYMTKTILFLKLSLCFFFLKFLIFTISITILITGMKLFTDMRYTGYQMVIGSRTWLKFVPFGMKPCIYFCSLHGPKMSK